MLRSKRTPGTFWRNARLGVAAAALLCVTSTTAFAAPSLPYGSYAAERQMILEQLPCKWISMNGHDGIRRDDSGYDFLCKGGVWATVSLMMDEAKLQHDGIGRVRLLFREWPEDVHPGGGEAYVAQEFLQYVIGHFVPANMADSVLEGFWKDKDRTWKLKGLTISMGLEQMGNHQIRRLEIFGSVGAVTPMVSMPTQTHVLPTGPVVPVEEPKAEHKGWGWFGTGEKPAQPAPLVKPAPPAEAIVTSQTVTFVPEALATPVADVMPEMPVIVVTPTVTFAAKEISKTALPVKAAVKPVVEAPKDKKGSKGWDWLFHPAEHAAETSGPEPLPMSKPVVAPVAVAVSSSEAVSNTIPAIVKEIMAKKGSVSDTTPPVFANEPAPESLVTPVPPPAVSDTLAPNAYERSLGRAAAPSQFDAYNKAEALTRKYEVKAIDDPNANAKVTAATPTEKAAQDTGLMKAPESTETPPALAPVPTPTVTTPTAAGLLNEAAPAADPMVVPNSDPRFIPERPMPQLKYIPKGLPAPKADQVIKFEDEKSGL